MTEQEKKSKLGPVVNAKKRIVVALIVAVVVIGGGVAYWHHHEVEKNRMQASADVTGAPRIESLPGSDKASNQYVDNQNQQNRQQDLQARKNATSNVPTITRPNFIGNPDQFGNAFGSHPSKTCPINKVVVMYKPNPASCIPQNLKLARDAGVTAEELRCQGCTCPALKLAGYNAADLKNVGFTATELKKCGYTLGQLVAAGFSASDLHDAGFSAKQLAGAGFSAGQLAAAGYSPDEIKKAGYTKAQLAAAGLENSVCNVTALKKARARGVSAAKLRAEGCGLAALKAAGFTAADLKAAGFTASDLKAAGFSDADLKKAGFTPEQIKEADNAAKVCNVENLKKQREAGVSALEMKNNGCSLAALKAAGYTAGELRAAGFSAKQLKDAGFSAKQLKAAGFSANDLKAAGFSAKQLKDAGFSAKQLKAAGFSAKDLKDAGFSAKALKNAGFSAAALKNAGYSAGQLREAGYTPKQLKDAGFSAKQLRAGGFSAADLASAFTPKELAAAGFTKGDLLRAGFTPKQAGYESVSKAVKAVQAAKPVEFSSVPKANANVPGVQENSPEAQLARLARMQQQQMTAQQRADSIQVMQGAMTAQAQKMLGEWSTNAQQAGKYALVVPKTAAAAGKGGANDADAGGPVIKAGTVMYAVLDTAINSDENTPIMAHVVQGPLKGAKLLGQFTREDKKVLINFNLVSVPKYPKSIGVNAVAIDPDTARTAVSGLVNNHYLLRYGTLFASAFLQGISDAIQTSGSTTSCPGGVGSIFGCTTVHDKLNTSQQVAVGLGKVGQQYSDKLGDNFDTPPTIKIPGGTGIGILLMQDLQLPLEKPALPAQ